MTGCLSLPRIYKGQGRRDIGRPKNKFAFLIFRHSLQRKKNALYGGHVCLPLTQYQGLKQWIEFLVKFHMGDSLKVVG